MISEYSVTDKTFAKGSILKIAHFVGQQNQQGETVTTPLASVQEEREETEWPQAENQTEPQENGTI